MTILDPKLSQRERLWPMEHGLPSLIMNAARLDPEEMIELSERFGWGVLGWAVPIQAEDPPHKIGRLLEMSDGRLRLIAQVSDVVFERGLPPALAGRTGAFDRILVPRLPTATELGVLPDGERWEFGTSLLNDPQASMFLDADGICLTVPTPEWGHLWDQRARLRGRVGFQMPYAYYAYDSGSIELPGWPTWVYDLAASGYESTAMRARMLIHRAIETRERPVAAQA